MMELFAKAEEKTPYVLVALQECERMNTLTQEMKKSLKMLDLGLKVCAKSCSFLSFPTKRKGLEFRVCRLYVILLLVYTLTHTHTHAVG